MGLMQGFTSRATGIKDNFHTVCKLRHTFWCGFLKNQL